MRRRTAIAAGLGVAAGLALLAGRAWLLEAPPAGAPAEFRVAPGEDLRAVADRLEAEGLAVSATRVRWVARLRGDDRRVRAGTFLLERGAPPTRLLDQLVTGKEVLRALTIPEGWRLDRIAGEVEAVLGVSADSVRAAASDPARRSALDCPAPTLEGYLFPDTYAFPDGATAGAIVDAMTERFRTAWAALEAEGPAAGDLDRHGLVTLASIVEAETPRPDERPRVAAVYRNRLERGMLLQADPTVRYGIGRFDGRLYYKHLDIDTPWNTYLHPGLPPGPIGSPGLASLRAARQPLPDCDDLYFVASGDGGHVFSRTHAEHERAVRAARRARDAAEAAAAGDG